MTSTAADADLRASVEALDEAVFCMTAVRDTADRIVDFRYEYCNPAALRVLHRDRAEVIGRHLLELFPSHLTNGLFDAYVRVTETGEPFRFEFAFDDGGVVGEFEVVVSRAGDGHVLAGHDISERKRQERELVLLKDQLQSALTSRIAIEQAKGYLAAITGVDPDSAFPAIRRYARNHNRRLSDVSAAIVAGELDLSGDVDGSA